MQAIIDPLVRLINFRADGAEPSGRISCVLPLRKLVKRSFSAAVGGMGLTFCLRQVGDIAF